MIRNYMSLALARAVLALAVLLTLAACGDEDNQGTPASKAAGSKPAEDIGITVADGFHATVFADNLGSLRHIAVNANGDLYAALSSRSEQKGIIALRDSDGDHVADVIERFGTVGGTGIAVKGGYLYRSSDTAIYRWKLNEGELVPSTAREQVAGGFTAERQHAAKSLTLDNAGHIYVNVGAPANACQRQMRTKGSPGMTPCPLLESHGGIWRFDATGTEQDQMADGTRFVSGTRNVVALAWNETAQALYGVQHGRDQLGQLWPGYFDDAQSAARPAEEFLRFDEGTVFGWPYTYYDGVIGKRMIAPEYGGDGKTPAAPGKYPEPLAVFPAHWAPNGLLFYSGAAFPARYRGGAFIAFHGSWNRAPLAQQGYKVVFVPFKNGVPAGAWEVFADGFAGVQPLMSPRDARFRPMGLAQAPDGALYIADSVKGRIWRIDYVGGSGASRE